MDNVEVIETLQRNATWFNLVIPHDESDIAKILPAKKNYPLINAIELSYAPIAVFAFGIVKKLLINND